MRRFWPWIFNGLTVLSVLLCVSAVSLWARSYRRYYFATRLSGVQRDRLGLFFTVHGIHSSLGHLYWDRAEARLVGGEAVNSGWNFFSEPAVLPFDIIEHLGFGFFDRSFPVKLPVQPRPLGSPVSRESVVAAPYWSVVVLTGCPAALRIGQYYRRRRLARRGCCPNCDYNLTGNISGVCPECGTETGKIVT
jgi:hypothetical protein